MIDQHRDDRDDLVIREYYAGDESEDLSREDYDDNATSIFRKKSMTPFIIGGAGFIVLVILFVSILSRPGSVAEKEQLQSLEARIQQLEKKLAMIGALDQALERFANQEREFNLLSERFSRFESTVTTQIDQVIKELGTLHQKIAQGPAPKARPPQAVEPPPKPTISKVHQVRAGETLYGISRRYNLTVEELQRYNNLGPNATIYPGQKLKLTPDGTQ